MLSLVNQKKINLNPLRYRIRGIWINPGLLELILSYLRKINIARETISQGTKIECIVEFFDSCETIC
jgi:hypothetical protein